jgi:predicted RNA-binding Zn ribbon-like protein
MSGALAEKYVFELSGGSASVDFVNSLSGQRQVAPKEHLEKFEDLVYWGEQVGLLTPAQKKRVMAAPQEGQRHAFASAMAWREALYEAFVAAVEHRDLPATHLEALNGFIAAAHAHRRLVSRGRGELVTEFFDDGDPASFLYPIALDALRILESPDERDRLRVCEESLAGTCGWVFLDQTKNRSRRFCSMKDCGNRAKQRRHYERSRR